MAIALLATIIGIVSDNYFLLFTGFIIGGTIGLVLAKKVEMTQMPELVAFLHSLVGLAAVLVGFANFMDHSIQLTGAEKTIHDVETYLGILIGALTIVLILAIDLGTDILPALGLGAADDHGVVAHRAADEPHLAGKGRRRPLPDHHELFAEVLLRPREVVVVVDLFHDAGAAWDDQFTLPLEELRKTAGVEFRVFMPVFNVPFRFFWAYNFDPLPQFGEQRSSFEFAIGTTF